MLLVSVRALFLISVTFKTKLNNNVSAIFVVSNLERRVFPSTHFMCLLRKHFNFFIAKVVSGFDLLLVRSHVIY